MITIHHLATSRSERIVWLMEELGLPYRLVTVARDPATRFAPPSLKAVHPLGRAPVIEDGSVVLAESGAIVEYIIARHGGGRLGIAADAPGFADYLFWLHFAEGSFLALLLREWYLDRMVPDPDAASGMARVRATSREYLGFVETHLATRQWFAGETFTGADVMMAFPFTTLQRFRPISLADYPAIGAWLGRIEQRPAWKRAMVLAGPDVAAPGA